MLTFNSFLQKVYHFVKTLAVRVTKKLYRTAAVLTTGMAVVMVITFTSSTFGGAGKNALAAFAEESAEEYEQQEDDFEETELVTGAKVQVGLTDSIKQGQLVVGKLLAEDVYRKKQVLLNTKAEIEKLNTETVMQAEEAAKAAEEKKLTASKVSLSEEDYQVFLRIVQAEAGVCDDKGKILVANVILNRVKSKRFPASVTDVVYQSAQFSPVSNGTINRVKVTEQTIDCVNRALSGEDYSQGALYFMYREASKSSSVKWFDKKLSFLFKHGNHEFFK